ncbi:MAG: hypothetical protein KC593_18265 [Myxococcales bacterium]|nr:hypothetical protein [Myxococcales bacterium]MCB9628683.1 hypothetical protein [Sandaracinaceae bacterium]
MKTKLYIYWPAGMELFTVALACSLDSRAIRDTGVNFALHFDPAQWMAMLLSPYFLTCAAFATFGMWKLHQIWKSGPVFSDTDKFAMVWFTMNACWYHTGCDVMSGLFQVMPNLRDAYAISNANHNFPMHDLHRIALDTVYWLELFIQLPMCVAVVVLYAKRSPARPVVEAFLCALHFAGTWAYYLPYMLMGETSNPIVSNIDRTVALAWVIVPALLAWRAMKQVMAMGSQSLAADPQR